MRLSRRGLGAAGMRTRAAVVLMGLLLLGAGALRIDVKSKATDGAAAKVDRQQIFASYGRLPLIFEANQGQSDPAVKFLAHGAGYGLFLTGDGAVLTLRNAEKGKDRSVIRMGLAGARTDVAVIGSEPLPGKSNYFIGNDPSKWRQGVPQFARVRYQAVYPGVDLVYYGEQGTLEYDFEIAPGADPRQIALHFADKPELLANGDLDFGSDGAHLRMLAPHVYQTVGSGKREISSRFELRPDNLVGFALGDYDHSRQLVIDPVLSYSTYLGGSGVESCSAILGLTVPPGPATPGCPGIAVDAGGNAYISGATTSADFPTTQGSLQPTYHTGAISNLYISKFNPTGSALLFSTYLGGEGKDYPTGIAVDSAGDVYVAGTTTSTQFPTNGSNAPFQSAPISPGNAHAFVSKIAPAGAPLMYSTYLSGNGIDSASGIALDLAGNVYVTGTTTSTESETGFPSTIGALQTTSKSTNQFFFTKIETTVPGPDSVPYSTYIGGSSPSNGVVIGGGIAVDASGNAYLTGASNFTDIPLLNAAQTGEAGGLDVYVAKINATAASGSQLLYATYLGGTLDDVGYGIAVDSSANAYITGSTASTNCLGFASSVCPTTSFQSAYGGGASDAFVAKLGVPCTGTTCTTTNVPFSYFTYIGGSGTDAGNAIAADTIGGAWVTGWTTSTDFPVLNNHLGQTTYGGGSSDAFITRIDTTATSPTAPGHNSAFFGGGGTDIGTGIALDTQGSAYLAGETSSSSGFPLLSSLYGTLNGPSDAFVSKLAPFVNLNVSGTAAPSPVGVGNQVTYTYTITNGTNTNGTITNPGDFVSGVTFTDSLPASGNATFTSATASPGQCGSPSGGTVVCNIGSLNSSATATVTVILVPTVGGTLGNTGSVFLNGSNRSSANPSVSVNDFALAVSPAAVTVPAGVPASYTAVVTPTGAIPDSVSLSCSSGLPTGATCTVTTNPIPNLDSGAASTTLVINTTARVTTTTRLWHDRVPFYATWLPISGLALLGVSIGERKRRQALFGMMMFVLFACIAFTPACSSHKSTTTTTGTPAGTYTVTVSATSGTAVHTTTVQLVVQ